MFSAKGKLLSTNIPLVMGIINITPDSFYDGSRFMDETGLLQHAEKMVQDGADILDIGGQSSRPGAERIDPEAELERILRPIALLHKAFPDIPISVDTWYGDVARAAVKAGASIVNDISGGLLDPAMLNTVGRLQVPYVCMHMKGTPSTMREEASYEDVTREVLDFFIHRIEDCRQAGIIDVILDPGMGFAKKPVHDLELLKNLSVFSMLRRPILLGISRKSVIYRALEITPADALNGTTVLHTLGLLNGANILRVHDPKEARQTIRLLQTYSR
jgi:dihydropteroate synthase